MGLLSNVRDDFSTLRRLRRARTEGRYHAFPWRSAAGFAAAVAYLVLPADLIPDFIVGFGLLDDAAMFAFVSRLLRRDLQQFRDWERKDEPR